MSQRPIIAALRRVFRSVSVLGVYGTSAAVFGAIIGVLYSVAPITTAPATARTLPTPRIYVAPTSVRPGDTTAVSSYYLAPLTDYQVQVCGNAGFGTTAECDLPGTTTAATSEAGHFSTTLIIEYPPVPCPCVVKATPLMDVGRLDQQEVSAPITIIGAPVSTPVPPRVNGTPSGLVVDSAVLVGTTSWAEWFGGTAHRTLLLQFRDAGANLIPSTPFVIRSGPAGNPTEVVGAPFVPPLHPGQVVSFRVPITFPPLAHGDYVVVGRLGNTGQIVTFKVTTSLMPWGIVILLALIVFAVLGLLIWRMLRRRRYGSDQADDDGPSAADPAIEEVVASDSLGESGLEPPLTAASSASDPLRVP